MKVSNEAVNVNAVEHKAALHCGSDRYISKVNDLERYALILTLEICKGFWEHLKEHFTQLSRLEVEKFDSYLVDSLCLTAA